jgi:RNA polymerase sigma-70 factor (ECF subfamily)
LKKTSSYNQTKEQLFNEKEIIEKAKKEPKQFEVLYNKYYEQIFYFTFSRTNDEDLTHDLTSQVFLSAMTNLYRYEFKGVPFSSWLYRIALNEINKHFNQNKTTRTVNIENEQFAQLTEELEQPGLEEHTKLLIEGLQKIDDDNLQIIELRYFEQLPFKEISEILEITENNAKVKLYRAIDKLKQLIKL